MAALTNQIYDALLKDYYTKEKIFNLAYTDRPFLAMLPKNTNYGGRQYVIPLQYADMQARSASYAQAKKRSTQTSLKSVDFNVTAVKDYAIGTIDNFTIATTKNDEHAHANALKKKIESTMNSLSNSIAYSLPRDSSGYLGQVSVEPTEGASPVFKMKFASDITTIEVDQVLEFFAAKTGGTAKTINGTITEVTVKSVDRTKGEFTIVEAYDSNGTIAADDFIIPVGDRSAKCAGLEDWLPWDAPTAGDNFFGVDRSVDTVRLAGVRHDGVGENTEQALIKLLHAIDREGGGSPDCILMNSENLQDLILILGSKVQYINVNVKHVNTGFFGVQIIGPKGPVKCISDRFMTSQYAYALDMKTWELCSSGSLVRTTDEDGNRALRSSDEDSLEIIYKSYFNLANHAPAHNGVVKLRN